MPVADPREELVLVLAPTGRDARLIADELGRHGFAALTCATLDRLCVGIGAGAGAAVLAEEALPPAGLACLVDALGRQPPWSDLPLLVLTGKGTPSRGSVRRFQVLEPVANVTQLERPVHTRTLVSAVRSALRARRRQYDVRGHLAERERLAETLGLAVAAADLGTWDWDPATDVITLSDRAAAVYGVRPGGAYRREELRRLIHPDHRDRASAAARAAAAGGTDYDVEYPLVRDDGRAVWVAARGRGVYAAGTLTRMLGVVQDVTARKTAEEALRVSEERHAMAQRAAGVGTWDWNLATGEVAWSEGLYLLLDLTPAELTPDPGVWRDLLHPDDLPEVAGRVEEAIRTGGEFYAEFRARRRDGSYVWVASRGRVHAPGGTPARFLGVNYDITQRKRVEDRLRASDDRFRAFMDHSPAAAWVTDEGGTVRYLSGTYRRMFKLPAGELVGATVFDLYPADIAREYLANIRRVADSGRPVEAVEPGLRPDGTVGQFLVYKFPLPGEGGLVGGVAVDITERLRAEDELREADRRKDEFLALLAHELRNPLAPIRNGLQMIRLSEDRATRERAQAMMGRQLGHMVRLIDDLLDVSRVSRNKMELRRARLLLSDAVASAVETVRPAVDAAGHELTVSLPDEPIHLDADLTRLAQVFGNLLGNSAKYTPPGGHIRLAAVARDGHAEVTVSDDGIGIPPASLPTVFGMFSQVDRSIERSTGGLGIGLALVKGLVEMHGGTVTAASDGPGRGSAFTVRLPLLRQGPGPARAEPNGAPAAGAGRRVLVVDDNRDAAESMAEMLRLLGYTADVAHDGVQAVAAAERVRPDVVLMDVGMPRMNGLDAARRIREQPWGRGAVIVALTGWGQEGDHARSKEAGCDGHLVKPVALDDLARALRSLRPSEDG